MRRHIAALIVPFLVAGCGGSKAPLPPVDAAATTKQADDSILAQRTQQAPALADTARQTLAMLLKHPESAMFDSLVVVQPPKDGSTWPSPWVCGRVGGKPGIGGQTTMTPFVYQNRINVFVLDRSNGAAFSALRAKSCDNPGARVLLR